MNVILVINILYDCSILTYGVLTFLASFQSCTKFIYQNLFHPFRIVIDHGICILIFLGSFEIEGGFEFVETACTDLDDCKGGNFRVAPYKFDTI